MTRDFMTVLQLTDLHLFADPGRLFNGVDTRNSFAHTLEHIARHQENPDVIVLTGDLAHDGDPQTYYFIADALKRFQAPVYFVLGNHDHPKNAHRVYPTFPIIIDQHCLLGNWQIVLIDSNHNPRKDSYEGEVSPAELQRIADLSGRYPEHWTLVAMHHNLPDHSDRGVALEVRNHEEVVRHLEGIPSVKIVLSGHVHQDFTIVQNGICYLSAPPTGYQSKSKSGRITGEVPGYRWLKLYQNGRFETDVRRISVWAS
ncbi:MAG: metallophosphoesterase family protein [Gammaproteobacteria bacterium]